MTTLSNPLMVAAAFFVATFLAGYVCGFLHGSSPAEVDERASQPDDRITAVAFGRVDDEDGAA